MSHTSVTSLSQEQILEAAQGKPLEDEERNVVDITRVRSEAESLNDLLDAREQAGHGRTLPGPDWLPIHAPLLQQQYDLLIPMLIKDRNAIVMARKMLMLFDARQNGKITGAHQDIEFGRLAAVTHFPKEIHGEIDTRAKTEIAKTMQADSAEQKMFYASDEENTESDSD